jgi:hypothetical protein
LRQRLIAGAKLSPGGGCPGTCARGRGTGLFCALNTTALSATDQAPAMSSLRNTDPPKSFLIRPTRYS